MIEKSPNDTVQHDFNSSLVHFQTTRISLVILKQLSDESLTSGAVEVADGTD